MRATECYGSRGFRRLWVGMLKYINLRRHFIHLARSIEQGTHRAVFEPNGEEPYLLIFPHQYARHAASAADIYIIHRDPTTVA